MKIFFSAGEPSGDLHGANLIRQLRSRQPNVEIVGYGGPKMAAAGCTLHADLTRLAVMWFARVLVNLHKFYWLLLRADRYFRTQQVDAVVLVDYPGFNWHIAKAAKKHGIPVFYYGVPQIWAWASWRIKKMRRSVDHVLCHLPFEEPWYRARGCRATYVGHPYFDELGSATLDEDFLAKIRRIEGPIVTVLPGSRSQELRHNLRWLVKACEIVHRTVPGAKFAVACYTAKQADYARELIETTDLPAGVFSGRTAELVHVADCCLAVSGSVSLELLYHTKPAVILYWISRPAYFVQGFFRKVKYITLVNLLACDDIHTADLRPFDPGQPNADRVPYPEYLTHEDRSRRLAEHAIEWLTDAAQRERKVAQLAQLKARVCQPGASARAAQYILDELAEEHRAAA